MPEIKTEESTLSNFSLHDPEEDFFGIPPVGGAVYEPRTKGKKEGNGEAKKTEAEGIKEVGEPEEEEKEVRDDDFFGAPAPKRKAQQGVEDDEIEVEEPPKPKPKPAPPKEKEKDRKRKEEEEEDDEQEGTDGKPEDRAGEGEEPGEDEEDDINFYTELAKENKERGVFQSIEIPKDKKINEDEFFELQDAEIEARVDETFEAFFEEMDDDGKEFLKFKKSGGSTRDFLTKYLQPEFSLEDFDEDNAAHVRMVNEYYMRNIEGKDDEEVQDGLDWLKDNGKEKTYAAKRFTKIKDTEKRRKEAVAEAVKQAQETRENEVKAFNQELIDVLTSTEKIGAFRISKAEQKDLGAYITKPSVKIGKNKYVPPFQVKVAQVFRAETQKDKEHLILLAKLFKNDFDVSDLEVETQTKVTRKAKSTLNKIKRGVKPTTSGSYNTRQLSDYFSDE